MYSSELSKSVFATLTVSRKFPADIRLLNVTVQDGAELEVLEHTNVVMSYGTKGALGPDSRAICSIELHDDDVQRLMVT
jgi:hypothetical protein